MTKTCLFARRDPRFRLPPDTAYFLFSDPATGCRHRGMVTGLGTYGFEFRLDEAIHDIAGVVLSDVCLQIHACTMPGDFIVKNVRERDDGSRIYGGIFTPSNRESALRLEGIVSGLQIAGMTED